MLFPMPISTGTLVWKVSQILLPPWLTTLMKYDLNMLKDVIFKKKRMPHDC